MVEAAGDSDKMVPASRIRQIPSIGSGMDGEEFH